MLNTKKKDSIIVGDDDDDDNVNSVNGKAALKKGFGGSTLVRPTRGPNTWKKDGVCDTPGCEIGVGKRD